MVSARHQACTGGSTYRAYVKIDESDAVFCKLIQVGSSYVRISMKSEISITLVIGDDQDDVGMGNYFIFWLAVTQK